MGQCPSPFWIVFQVSNFFIFRELQMVLTHPKLLSITKLLGAEFIISHTFQSERYFSFACHKCDFAGYCSIYRYIISV